MRRRLFIALLAGGALRADKPPQAPQDYTVDSPNKRYYAFADAKGARVSIFARRNGRPAKLFDLPGWHRHVAVADDGRHVVIGYEGGGILPLAFRKDQVLLSFYDRTSLLRKVTLAEMVANLSRLETAESHVYWGRFIGFDARNRYQVETVEGPVAFDVTGRRL
jgi:hypothetical protein